MWWVWPVSNHLQITKVCFLAGKLVSRERTSIMFVCEQKNNLNIHPHPLLRSSRQSIGRYPSSTLHHNSVTSHACKDKSTRNPTGPSWNRLRLLHVLSIGGVYLLLMLVENPSSQLKSSQLPTCQSTRTWSRPSCSGSAAHQNSTASTSVCWCAVCFATCLPLPDSFVTLVESRCWMRELTQMTLSTVSCYSSGLGVRRLAPEHLSQACMVWDSN